MKWEKVTCGDWAMQMQDLIGQQLGNYRLLALLGSGGFARVYLGEHIFLGNQARAAIKVLNETKLSDEDGHGFIIEARTIRKLNHPHIIKVLEFGIEVSRNIDTSIPYLVMDYAPNGTLRDRHPRNTSVPIQQIMSYVDQVADALQFAHDQGIVHRDVKPANMLVLASNEVVVSDFGIAITGHDSTSIALTKEDAVQGTFAYIAPERFLGTTRRSSDQYSLGIVVYEWLAGIHPFKDAAEPIIFMHLNVPPPPLYGVYPNISQEVDRVVMRALAKDPELRYPSIKDFSQALNIALQASTQPAYQLNIPEQPVQKASSENTEEPTQYREHLVEPTLPAKPYDYAVKAPEEGYPAFLGKQDQPEDHQDDLGQQRIDSGKQSLEADTDKIGPVKSGQQRLADTSDNFTIPSHSLQQTDGGARRSRQQTDKDEQYQAHQEPQQHRQGRPTIDFHRQRQQQSYQGPPKPAYPAQQQPDASDQQTWQPQGGRNNFYETSRSSAYFNPAPATSPIPVQQKVTVSKRRTFVTSLKRTLRKWFELDPEFARIPKNKTFRNLGIVLNILSAILIGLLQQPPSAWFILWGILYSLVFFHLCIRLVNSRLSMGAGVLVAVYWGYFSTLIWNGIYLYGPYIPRFSPFVIVFLSPLLLAIFVFMLSAYLHIRYVMDRMP
jgi:serine/threonine protein kinase